MKKHNMKKHNNFAELSSRGVKIFSPSENVQPQDVCDNITLSGVCIFQNFLTMNEGDISLKKVIEEADNLLSTTDLPGYRFGNAIRRNAAQIEKASPNLFSAFVNPFFREIARLYGMPHPGDIFLTHDFNSYQDTGDEVNGHLHYDRRQTLKFFLYLTDVDKNRGAFSVLPGSRDQGSRWREENPKMNRIYTSQKHNTDAHRYGLEFLKNDTLPIEGPVGTVIAFDSDILHFGGRVERGRERKVARAHYRRTKEDF